MAGVEVDPALVIPPWRYDRIVANVGRICVVHGVDDDVILPEEARKISAGLEQAAAAAVATDGTSGGGGTATAARCVARVELRLEEGLGHAMEKQCPAPLLDAILKSLLSG
eukprot:COSAG01_NODE_1800_length_9205_cov_18.778058_9_plen_111_part_00